MLHALPVLSMSKDALCLLKSKIYNLKSDVSLTGDESFCQPA